jgi:magnesium-transporting ATPase (P-type)
VTIEAGMKIPADCILIEGMDVECDESMYKDGMSHVQKKMVESMEKNL